MGGEDRALDAQASHPGHEVLGLRFDRNVPVHALGDRCAVAGHFPGEDATALDARRDLTPERRTGRDAVDQDEGITRSGFFPPHVDPIDGDAMALHGVTFLCGYQCSRIQSAPPGFVPALPPSSREPEYGSRGIAGGACEGRNP